MRYLHTMIRVSDPDATIRFFELLGLKQVRRIDNEGGRFSLIFLAAPGDEGRAEVELTHNWDPEIYTAARRAYGVRPAARRHLDRTVAGRCAAAGRTLGLDAQCR